MLDNPLGVTPASSGGAVQSSGSQAQTPSAPVQQNGTDRPAWVSQLPGDLQGHETWNRFTKLGDLGKTFLELEGKTKEYESKLEKAVILPGEGATPEELDAFYERLGAPKDEGKYDLKIDSPEYKANEEAEKRFRAMAKNAKLTPSQAKALFKGLVDMGSESAKTAMAQIESTKKAQADAAKAAEETLKREWGDNYAKNTEVFKRTLGKYFADPELAKAVNESGLGNNPAFVKAMHKIAAEMRDDELLGSGVPGASRTPGVIDYPSMRK